MINTKKGTLVLLDIDKCPHCGEEENLHYNIEKYVDTLCNKCGEFFKSYKPIIVCDDQVLPTEEAFITKDGIPKKILVDTPQIPQDVLYAITSGELKDGDELEVKIVKQDVLLDSNYKAIIEWSKQPILYTEEEVKSLLDRLFSRINHDIDLGNSPLSDSYYTDNWFKENKKK